MFEMFLGWPVDSKDVVVKVAIETVLNSYGYEVGSPETGQNGLQAEVGLVCSY